MSEPEYLQDLRPLIHQKVEELGDTDLTALQDVLCDELGADEIEFLDAFRRVIHRRAPLHEVLARIRFVNVRMPVQLGGRFTPEHDDNGRDADRRDYNAPQRPARMGDAQIDEVAIIREMDRLEQRNGPSWAGFLVKTMLPRLGYSTDEARHILKLLEVRGLTVSTRRENPRNPDRPATFVELNRNNPRVAEALG